MSKTNSLAYATKTQLQANARKTADFTSGWVDVRAFAGLIGFMLNLVNVSGTNPVFTLTIDTSEDQSTVVDAGYTSGAVATLDKLVTISKSKLRRYVRLKGVIGGTSTPTLDVQADVIAFKKYIK